MLVAARGVFVVVRKPVIVADVSQLEEGRLGTSCDLVPRAAGSNPRGVGAFDFYVKMCGRAPRAVEGLLTFLCVAAEWLFVF